MKIPKTTRGILKHAKETSVYMAKDANKKGKPDLGIRWEQRAKYYEKLLARFTSREDGLEIPRRAFVSYSKNSATMHYKAVRNYLEKDGFDVKDGFQDHKKAEGKVLKTVLNQMRTCSLFIGILTQEYQYNHTGKMRWSPSIWSLAEIGMAISIGIPYILLVQEEIHEDCWRKVSPEKVHFHFNDDDFDNKCIEMIEMANNLFNAYAIRKGRTLNIENIRPW